MEKIKVNMTPNPLDVQTIHASQNDGEARQWEFELHNNGDAIDSSSISDQLVFKAYKGGTEEILPTNGSTPTTSPFNGDIKYPQGLLTDQEFLYRESPTEEDGLAKITDIKGNTLVWNQLVGTNVNGLSTIQGTTFSLNSNGSIHVTGTGTGNHFCEWRTYENPSFVMVKGHKYLAAFKGLTNGIIAQVSVYTTASTYLLNKIDLVGSYAEIVTPTQDGITSSLIRFYTTSTFSGTTDIIMQLFDLTQMGLDSITDPSDFTSLFPLSYYSYNQGSLLSFMGNGIKTLGKNLAPGISQGAVDIHGGTTSNEKRLRVDGFVRVFQGEHYTFTAKSNSGKTLQIYTRYFADADGSEQVSYLDWLNLPRSIIIPSGVNYATFTIRFGNNDNITLNDISDVQVEHGTSATSYEPYTSSTLSLPISTYFPSGMKSAGSVYDELTESKAITRVGTVVFNGTQSFTGPTSANNFWIEKSDVARSNDYTLTMSCDKLDVMAISGDSGTHNSAKWISAYPNNSTSPNTNWIYIHIDGITTKEDLTTWLQANPVTLNYELKTPTETSFTTASLVTENAEIPLSNEDGVLLGKCTEQLSENPGFIDAKIKLSDSDGECYSNKIQLHVERSPQ